MSDNNEHNLSWPNEIDTSKTSQSDGHDWVLSNESASWPGKSNASRNLMSETKQAE